MRTARIRAQLKNIYIYFNSFLYKNWMWLFFLAFTFRVIHIPDLVPDLIWLIKSPFFQLKRSGKKIFFENLEINVARCFFLVLFCCYSLVCTNVRENLSKYKLWLHGISKPHYMCLFSRKVVYNWSTDLFTFLCF